MIFTDREYHLQVTSQMQDEIECRHTFVFLFLLFINNSQCSSIAIQFIECSICLLAINPYKHEQLQSEIVIQVNIFAFYSIRSIFRFQIEQGNITHTVIQIVCISHITQPFRESIVRQFWQIWQNIHYLILHFFRDTLVKCHNQLDDLLDAHVALNEVERCTDHALRHIYIIIRYTDGLAIGTMESKAQVLEFFLHSFILTDDTQHSRQLVQICNASFRQHFLYLCFQFCTLSDDTFNCLNKFLLGFLQITQNRQFIQQSVFCFINVFLDFGDAFNELTQNLSDYFLNTMQNLVLDMVDERHDNLRLDVLPNIGSQLFETIDKRRSQIIQQFLCTVLQLFYQISRKFLDGFENLLHLFKQRLHVFYNRLDVFQNRLRLFTEFSACFLHLIIETIKIGLECFNHRFKIFV